MSDEEYAAAMWKEVPVLEKKHRARERLIRHLTICDRMDLMTEEVPAVYFVRARSEHQKLRHAWLHRKEPYPETLS